MGKVACSRCFSVFDDPAARPGAAPLCPACTARAPSRPSAAEGPAASTAPVPRRADAPAGARRSPSPGRPRAPRRSLALAGAALAALAAAGGAVLVARLRAPPPPPARVATAAERVVERWREEGKLPAPPPAGRSEVAAARRAAGEAALAADLPARSAEALLAFREALGAEPDSWEAAAGLAEAVADLAADEDSDAGTLRDAHEIVAAARAAAGDPPLLLAAWSRLVLAVPSASNRGEALAAAEVALAAAPAEPRVRLAAGLARAASDPAAGAAALQGWYRADRRDRRLLSAAARARWAAGDAGAALALAEERLALDPLHPGALALAVELEGAAGRLAAAVARLERWLARAPDDPVASLLLARIAYQADRDLPSAQRHLDAAIGAARGDFLVARIEAHRAALARARGDRAAALEAVRRGLARVPASGPARFQAALLAFDAGDAPGLRESAGVLGERGGRIPALLLAARSQELSATLDEAVEAFRAAAAAAPRDPAVLLGVAGALARLGASGPALAVAKAALARDPLEARLLRPPTDCWEGPGALAEAAARLETIGRSEARAGPAAYAAAAASALALGHTVRADALARRAAQAAPGSPAPLLLLAQVALDRGEPARALALARAAAHADGASGAARAVHARALEALGRNAEAEDGHRSALKLVPDLVPSRLALARLAARRGDLGEARGLLEGLLAEDPDLAEARGALLDLAAPRAPAPKATAKAAPPRPRPTARPAAIARPEPRAR
jgi:tetratricopeptide (TPR) repeat protein